MGKILIKEGTKPKLAAMFYREVTQAVLILGLETWVLYAAVERMLDRIHLRFLRKSWGSRRDGRRTGHGLIPRRK